MSGKFRHCAAGDFSFGVSALMQSTAEFHNCVAGANAFGDKNNGGIQCASQFYNCSGGGNSWTYGSTSTAKYINCTAGDGSFGFATNGAASCQLSGTYSQCISGNGSFGSVPFSVTTGAILDGLFVDCSAGNFSFGWVSATGSTGVSITGKLINCKAGTQSFGWINSGGGKIASMSAAALLDNCTAGDGSFCSTTGSLKQGELRRCRTYNYLTNANGMASDNGVLSGIMRDCIWEVTGAGLPALKIADGAKIYGGEYRTEATATKSIESSTGSPINAAIANIMADVAIDTANITNVITSPNVIIDADI
jgi:hypothetical protein